MTVKFILGTPAYPDKPISQQGIDRSALLRSVNAEMKEHGDMVMLDVSAFGIPLTLDDRQHRPGQDARVFQVDSQDV